MTLSRWVQKQRKNLAWWWAGIIERYTNAYVGRLHKRIVVLEASERELSQRSDKIWRDLYTLQARIEEGSYRVNWDALHLINREHYEFVMRMLASTPEQKADAAREYGTTEAFLIAAKGLYVNKARSLDAGGKS